MPDGKTRFAAARDAIPFALWWQRAVVANVDHERVIARVEEESGWTARYLFMTLMSAGIAVLGLLLSSPAVVIGAMLISPLMGPILGLGFSLALFDFSELRRSVIALVGGTAAALLFTALIVLASPLKEATSEILARTRPNLFDLLVAMFAALAGTFAIIRGRGETIVGVAIATALMPPIAVMGYGVATWNMSVLSGSLALFVTNFVTIALAAAVLARLYGFGHTLSEQQSMAQTVVLVLVFLAMAVPLGYSLRQIAGEAVAVNRVRAFLSGRFGEDSRVSQLDVDFDAKPWQVRAVVIAPRSRAASDAELSDALKTDLGRPVSLHVDQVLLSPGANAEQAQREELKLAQVRDAERAQEAAITRMVAVAAGISSDAVTIDRAHRRATATAKPLPGAGLDSYRQLESRISAAAQGWTVAIVPPVTAMPEIVFTGSGDTLGDDARNAVLVSAWAAKRWNAARLAVPGLPDGEAPARPSLAARRALAVAAVLKDQGLATAPARAAGARFRLRTAAPAGAAE